MSGTVDGKNRTRSSRTTAAWSALQRALTAYEPACRDDPRFLADGRGRGPENYADLRRICASCPVFNECRTYAESATKSVLTGFWAGLQRSRHTPDDRL